MGNLCCKRIVWFPGSRSLENDFDHFSTSKTELRSSNDDASCAIDELLEGRMDLEVVLPDSRRVRLCVERRTPMMDVLVRAASAHKLSPGGLVIKPPSSHDNLYHTGRYKPSTPIGALDVGTVFVIPKKDLLADGKRLHATVPRRCPPPYRGQETFRMSIHLPGNQLAVARVSGETTASQLTARVCGEKGLDPQRYRLVHPQSLDKPIDKDTTMREYGDIEVTLLPLSRIKEQTCFQNSNCFGFFCGDATLQSTRSTSKIISQTKRLTLKKKKRLAPSPPTSSSSPCISTNDEDDGRTDEDYEAGVISSSSSSGVSSFDGGGLPASTLSLIEVGDEQTTKPKRPSNKSPAPPPPVQSHTISKLRRAPTPVAYTTHHQDDSEEDDINEPCTDNHQIATGPSCEVASEPQPVTRQEITSHIEDVFHSFLLEDGEQLQATTSGVKEEEKETVDQAARAPEVIGYSQAADDRTSQLVDSEEQGFFWAAAAHETGSLPRLHSSCELQPESETGLSREEEPMREYTQEVDNMPVNSARTLRQTHSLPNGAGELLEPTTLESDSPDDLTKEVVVGGRSPFVSRSLSCEPSGARNGTLHRALIDIPLLYVDPLLEQNSSSYATTGCTSSTKAYTSSLRSSTNKTRFKPPQVRTTGKCRQRLPPEVRKESTPPSVRFEISHPKIYDPELVPDSVSDSKDNVYMVFNDKTNIPGTEETLKIIPIHQQQVSEEPLVDQSTYEPENDRIVCALKSISETKHASNEISCPPPPPLQPISRRSSQVNSTTLVGMNCRDALLQEIVNFGGRRALKRVLETKLDIC